MFFITPSGQSGTGKRRKNRANEGWRGAVAIRVGIRGECGNALGIVGSASHGFDLKSLSRNPPSRPRDLIAAIYDAAIDPSEWEDVVKRIVDTTKSVCGGLFVEETDAAHLSAVHSVDPFYVKAFC
jgi:hypothetical protein